MRALLVSLAARAAVWLPRRVDLVPAVSVALVGFLPLAALRTWVALEIHANSRVQDLLRVHYGDLEFWGTTGLVVALLLRPLQGRAHWIGRSLAHLFGTVALVASCLELVFLAVTGSRADVDMLLFAWRDLEQVWPVVQSELGWLHGLGAVAALGVGFGPMLLPWPRERDVPGAPLPRAVAVAGLLLPVLLLELPGRPLPTKVLRLAQASFLENLYWDALESVGDKTLPPPPEQLEPVRIARVPEAKQPNIVLVMLESTGFAHTSVGSPALDTTPTLAAMAKEGLWAPHHTTVVPHTSKSLVSTLCGQVPVLRTAIDEARALGLPGRCLPELLEEVGYRTAFLQTANDAFEHRADLIHHMGFDFARMRDSLPRGAFQQVNYFGWEDRAMLVPGIAWAAEQDPRPFFQTWLTLTSHHDYKVPTTFEKRESYPGVSARPAAHLDAVRYVDTFLGELVEGYREAGLLENTVFIVQGDHGEAFGEHGRSQHDLVIWEEGLRIPLVIWGTPLQGRTGTIDGPRQVIDVLPTALELAGARVEGGWLPGASLLGEVPENRALYHSCWRSHRCLAERVGNTKVVDHYRERAPQRFDLAADPSEKKDLSREIPAEALATQLGRAREWRSRVNGRYDALVEQRVAQVQQPDEAPAIASYDGQLDALGCTVTGPKQVVRGERVWVRCRWRARSAMSAAWKGVLRLEGGFTAVESQAPPMDGLLPTFKWLPGMAVPVDLQAQVPAFARAGEVVIKVGWSRYGGGRLTRDDGGGEWIEAGRVQVVLPSASGNAPSVSATPAATAPQGAGAEDEEDE